MRIRPVPALLGVAVALAAGFVAAGWRNARESHVTRDDLVSPDLPPEFDGARVVFLSDVHAGILYSRSRVAGLVDLVNALEPDILLLGGDYVGGHTGGWRRFYPEAARFTAKLGCFAVLGNHDVWEDGDKARERLAEAGFRVLENETAAVCLDGAHIHVTGLADQWTGTPDAVEASAGLAPQDFAVLVAHNPDTLAEALPATRGLWDLALVGHLHGGQLVIGGRPLVNSSRFGYRYHFGWMSEEGVPILVSNGVGTVTVPLRHAADSQVHVITLRRGGERPSREEASAL